MSLNIKALKRAKFSTRTVEVPVPELKQFFDEGTDLVWTVRNLSGIQIGHINDSAAKYDLREAAAEAMAGKKTEQVDAFKTLFGLSGKMTILTAKKTEMIVAGSVSPECDVETAALIRDHYPTVFDRIVSAVDKLTGQGSDPGKQDGFGKVPTPKPV